MDSTEATISQVEKNLKELKVEELNHNQSLKEWHVTVTAKQREGYTNSLCEMLRTKGFTGDAETVAQDIESTIFGLAKNRAEYYHMTAEKLYQICKDYED